MAAAWPALRGSLIGAAALIAITSAAAAGATARYAHAIEPPVWVENPFGLGVCPALAWHATLAAVFGTAAALCSFNSAARLIRIATAASLTIAAILAFKDAISYYRLVALGQIATTLPIPLSAAICLLATTMAAITFRRWPTTERSNAWTTRTITGSGVLAGAISMVLMHIVSFGTTDYRRHADVAIILGAKVYPDGTPSTSLEDRLMTGIELYQSGQVQYLLMTGGTGVEGCNEAMAMREFAEAAGVPTERILLDPDGNNTLASAQHCHAILAERALDSALLVSHYFHLARCKMLFTEQGIQCVTVPAQMHQRLRCEPFFVARECVAYLTYCMERPWREIDP